MLTGDGGLTVLWNPAEVGRNMLFIIQFTLGDINLHYIDRKKCLFATIKLLLRKYALNNIIPAKVSQSPGPSGWYPDQIEIKLGSNWLNLSRLVQWVKYEERAKHFQMRELRANDKFVCLYCKMYPCKLSPFLPSLVPASGTLPHSCLQRSVRVEVTDLGLLPWKHEEGRREGKGHGAGLSLHLCSSLGGLSAQRQANTTIPQTLWRSHS